MLHFLSDGRVHGKSAGKPVSLVQGQFDEEQGVYLWGEMMAMQLKGTLSTSEKLKEAILHGECHVVNLYTFSTNILSKRIEVCKTCSEGNKSPQP